MLAAAALAVLASAGLSACRTNVGVAATADGHRITESQVNAYLTRDAQPVQVPDASGASVQVSPRTYVLQTIITERLYAKILEMLTQQNKIDEQQITAAISQILKGDSAHHFVETHGLRGFTAKFAELALRGSVLVDDIRTVANNGVDLQPVLAKLKYPVSVNPRYGAWDPKNYAMSTDPTAGLPKVLRLPAAVANGASTANR